MNKLLFIVIYMSINLQSTTFAQDGNKVDESYKQTKNLSSSSTDQSSLSDQDLIENLKTKFLNEMQICDKLASKFYGQKSQEWYLLRSQIMSTQSARLYNKLKTLLEKNSLKKEEISSYIDFRNAAIISSCQTNIEEITEGTFGFKKATEYYRKSTQRILEYIKRSS